MQRLVLIGSNVVVMWSLTDRLDLSHEIRTLESGASLERSLESLEMVGSQRGSSLFGCLDAVIVRGAY